MNEDLIADLKQFIAATVSQVTTDLSAKVDGLGNKVDDLGNEVQKLRSEMNTQFTEIDKRFDDLDLKVHTIADTQAEAIEGHEQRITRLERRTA